MSDFKQKVGCCFFLFAKNGHFHDSKAIFLSKSENFKFASNWPILTKIAKIKGKMAFLWNFKQTLLNQMGVDKPIFGNFRGQKRDLAKIDFLTHGPPYDPKTPSRLIGDLPRKNAFLPDSDQILFIQIGVE